MDWWQFVAPTSSSEFWTMLTAVGTIGLASLTFVSVRQTARIVSRGSAPNLYASGEAVPYSRHRPLVPSEQAKLDEGTLPATIGAVEDGDGKMMIYEVGMKLRLALTNHTAYPVELWGVGRAKERQRSADDLVFRGLQGLVPPHGSFNGELFLANAAATDFFVIGFRFGFAPTRQYGLQLRMHHPNVNVLSPVDQTVLPLDPKSWKDHEWWRDQDGDSARKPS